MENLPAKLRGLKVPLVWCILLALAFLLGYCLKDGGLPPESTSKTHEHGIMETGVDSAEHVSYLCPMMCVPPMGKPGQCPVCGMDLTPVATGTEDGGPAKIELSDEAARKAEIQLASVERKSVTAEVRLFGRIEYDPVEQYRVTAYAPGVIDRIYVKRAGQTVRKGDALFDLHSPELFFLEQELHEVLRNLPYKSSLRPSRGQNVERWMRPPWLTSFGPSKGEEGQVSQEEKAAWEKLSELRRKMQLLGLSDDAIELVVARGQPTGISTITTPTTGVVLDQKAFKGSYVNTGDLIFTIANPRYTWARMDAYESDFAWLRLGQEVEFETDAFPGEKFEGKLLYLDPNFDPQTRTFTVGILYQESKGRFRPNMLVRSVVRSRMCSYGVCVPGRDGEEHLPLVIPDTAPLLTGTRAVVYVADPLEPRKYEGREVTLGPRATHYYIVKSGLQKGERVVVNGNFKIDSAVQILAKPSMMGIEGEQPALTQHFHGGSETLPAIQDGVNSMEMEESEEKAAPQTDLNTVRPRGQTSRQGPGPGRALDAVMQNRMHPTEKQGQ
jgi:Cu(I)/Ag(I) efflux system membrane fusion protein